MCAQSYENTMMRSTAPSSMQIGSSYSSQVSPVGAAAPMLIGNESSGPSNRRNAFPGRPETNQSDESPVGEPFILLLFAAMAAVGIYIKRKKTSQA